VIVNVDFEAEVYLLIIHSAFIRYFKKWKYDEAVFQLFIDFKKGYDSARREVLYNILVEFSIPMKLIRIIKMCLTENYNRVRIGNDLSDMFPIRNGLKQGDVLSQLFFNFAPEFAVRSAQVSKNG